MKPWPGLPVLVMSCASTAPPLDAPPNANALSFGLTKPLYRASHAALSWPKFASTAIVAHFTLAPYFLTSSRSFASSSGVHGLLYAREMQTVVSCVKERFVAYGSGGSLCLRHIRCWHCGGSKCASEVDRPNSAMFDGAVCGHLVQNAWPVKERYPGVAVWLGCVRGRHAQHGAANRGAGCSKRSYQSLRPLLSYE